MTDASNGSIIVYEDKLLNVFKKVKEIQDALSLYCLAPENIPVSIEDIRYAIEQKYGIEIKKEVVDFDAVHIRGMVERWKDGTAIVIVREKQDENPVQNEYWKRFIAVKEMCHVAIDEPEDWNPKATEVLSELITEYGHSKPNPARADIQAEALAEIAAFELLYPMEFRRRDFAKGYSVPELSNFFHLPPYVIDRSLDIWYMEMSEKYWNEAGGLHPRCNRT